MIYRISHYIFIYAFLFFTSFLYSYVPYKQLDSTLYTKIETFVAHAKDSIATDQDGARLSQTLDRCATISLHKIEKLAHEIRAIDSHSTADTIRVAALLQLIIPIVDTFKKIVMNNITTLEMSKKYWELQREDRMHHELLSYIPHVAQFAGTPKEINDKITQLDTYLEGQFKNLGSLTLHLDMFDEHQTPDTYYAWIQQVCTIIIAAYPDAKLQPCEASCDHVIKIVILASKCVMHYPSAFHAQSAPYLMPTNVKQNLAKWLGAAAVVCYGLYRVHEEREVLQHRIQQGAENISHYVNLQGQFIKDTLFEQNEMQKEEVALKNEYEARLMEIHKALSYAQSKEGKQEDDKVEHHAWENLDPFLKRDFNPLVIHQKAQELDINYLKLVTGVLGDMIDKESQELGASLARAGTTMANADYTIKGNLWGTSKASAAEVVSEMGQVMKKVAPLIDTLAKYPKAITVQGYLFQEKFWTRMLKQHRIGIAIISTIPLYLLLRESGKMVYALYKKIRGTMVYDAIREALVDIDLLLAIYDGARPSEMAVDDYGRLIYLIGRLKDPQMIKNVPYECRASFASHVQFLESSTLSATEKMKMIDLMYKRYPFLMYDPRYTAKA